jgi:hypothetical protein
MPPSDMSRTRKLSGIGMPASRKAACTSGRSRSRSALTDQSRLRCKSGMSASSCRITDGRSAARPADRSQAPPSRNARTAARHGNGDAGSRQLQRLLGRTSTPRRRPQQNQS